MNDEIIVVVARFKVKEDSVEEAKRLALAMAADSRIEAGCINYDVHQSLKDPTVFVWHETWKDRAALDAHFEMPYLKEFVVKAGELAAEPPQITLTKKLSD